MYVFQPNPTMIEQKAAHAYIFDMDGLFMFERRKVADKDQWFHRGCVVYTRTNYTKIHLK